MTSSRRISARWSDEDWDRLYPAFFREMSRLQPGKNGVRNALLHAQRLELSEACWKFTFSTSVIEKAWAAWLRHQETQTSHIQPLAVAPVAPAVAVVLPPPRPKETPLADPEMLVVFSREALGSRLNQVAMQVPYHIFNLARSLDANQWYEQVRSAYALNCKGILAQAEVGRVRAVVMLDYLFENDVDIRIAQFCQAHHIACTAIAHLSEIRAQMKRREKRAWDCV